VGTPECFLKTHDAARRYRSGGFRPTDDPPCRISVLGQHPHKLLSGTQTVEGDVPVQPLLGNFPERARPWRDIKTWGFPGEVIFGAIENSAPITSDPDGYDAVIVIEGPPEDVSIRIRDPVGVSASRNWVDLANVPAYYRILSNRAIDDITRESLQTEYHLDLGRLPLSPSQAEQQLSPTLQDKLRRALNDQKLITSLYGRVQNGVTFMAPDLFRGSIYCRRRGEVLERIAYSCATPWRVVSRPARADDPMRRSRIVFRKPAPGCRAA
jgi:hypothetical protein